VCRPQSRKRRQDLALSPDNYCMYVMNLDDGILQGGMTCMIGFDRAYEPLIDTCDLTSSSLWRFLSYRSIN
jgi:hypothetical protein